MHLIFEIFTVDIPLHGPMAHYHCAILEALHLKEKDIYGDLNRNDTNMDFATKVQEVMIKGDFLTILIELNGFVARSTCVIACRAFILCQNTTLIKGKISSTSSATLLLLLTT